MSERQDSECQKHDLPKSLQGTEDAEVIWSMILERFPNAAPLLCEMEAVVDRAEDLLQQLRAPCQREIETSTSFCTPDSENSSMLISARESLSIGNDSCLLKNAENGGKSVAGVQVSDTNVHDADVSPDQNDIAQSNESRTVIRRSVLPKDNALAEQRAKEARSLEEWEKVVDIAMKKSVEDDVNDGFREDAIDADRKRSKSKERRRNRSSSDEAEKGCIILHQQEKCAAVGDSTIEVDSNQTISSQELIETNDDTATMLKGSGDENSLRIPEKRTPLSILEAYAKRCKVQVAYQHVTDGPYRYKSNVFAIRGSLGGFTATTLGDSEETAKNSVATKILQMIANQQMDDGKLGTLAYLSRDEMLEISNLCLKSPRTTGQRRLYLLCLEEDQPVPKYTVEKAGTYEGFNYSATCSALGCTSKGRGVRECVAKKSAAEELYRRYCQGQRSSTKVTV
ncbi:uncharacterized protein LOC116428322 [Nomia melanderi]|uniref:uncharacterized protein LOC116428322 n=1 Tax=Nomia melanderi TaxID=2448451 RepID=UPI0013045B29|nr:uncharacterized protein LOC116428322 [Nomia melanderi]